MYIQHINLLNIILLAMSRSSAESDLVPVDAQKPGDHAAYSQSRPRLGRYFSRNPQHVPQWTTWGLWGTCTRSCGGGVRSRTRTCRTAVQHRDAPRSGNSTRKPPLRCKGDRKQYSVCATQACPAGQVSGLSFRAAQCRVYNQRRVFGRVVNTWVPYVQQS
ncbi:unnamed protein product, partial [Meganyctiphanes norvegica]